MFGVKFWTMIGRTAAVAATATGVYAVTLRVTNASVDFMKGGMDRVFETGKKNVGKKLEKEGKELQGKSA